MESSNVGLEGYKKKLYLLLFLIFISTSSFCAPYQADSDSSLADFRGLPFINNFNSAKYLHLTSQIEHSAILQDNSGRMLIGSYGGILVYNGNNWHLIELPGRSQVWSLAKDSNGRIFVGASDNLGYLTPDSAGKTHFVSLLAHLPAELRSVGDVWQTVATPEGVYFRYNHHLMRWKDNKFKVWKSEKAFGPMQLIIDKLYIHVPEQGLMVLNQDRLELFSADKIFAQSPVKFLLPLNSDKWLVGTFPDRLYYFDGQKTTPVTKPVASFLQANTLFAGFLLPNSAIAITTLKGGMVIIDQQANIKRIINKESGLISNTIYLVDADNQGGLWLSHEKGLSRVQLNSSLSYFDESNGLIRETYAMCKHRGELYAGTTDGLFVLNPQTGYNPSATFHKVKSFNHSIWNLESVGNSLLIASVDGLFEWKDEKIISIPIVPTSLENYILDIQSSIYDSNLVFVASRHLYAFRYGSDSWKKVATLEGLPENCSQIIHSPSGDLWLRYESGIIRARFPNARDGKLTDQLLSKPTIDHFGGKQGLPENIAKIYLIGNELLVQSGDTDPKMYRFRETSNSFEPAAHYGLTFGLSGEIVHPATEKSNGDQIWLWTKNQAQTSWQLKHAIKELNGTYLVKPFELNSLTYPLKRFFYEQPGRAVWFSSADGLVRLDEYAAKDMNQPFGTILERIVVAAKTVYYPGTQTNVRLPFAENSLRFEFAAPIYNSTDENRFQYWMEGLDENWSDWTNEYFKEYSRLPEGKYTFYVRAKNARGQLGKQAAYAFTILPPFYRTAYMYIGYLLLAGGALYGLLRWRSSQQEAEKAYLESIIAQRTREIAHKNEQLSRQTQQLQELDGVKSHFFANISHEFRTPLTLILNTILDKLSILNHTPGQAQVAVGESELQVMSRNAKRLLQLINQLLDLSKIESGKMELQLQNGDLKRLLQVVSASFSSLSEHEHIHLGLHLPDEPLLCQYDEDKLEKILYNLLSNAFKFTHKGGEVSLIAKLIGEGLPSSTVQIIVRDNGPGIPREELPHIFNRFYQGKQYYSDAQGTGIGLSLTKELAELHGGRVWAESELGKGTAFIVELPLMYTMSDPLQTVIKKEQSHTLTTQLPEIEILPEQPQTETLPLTIHQNDLPVVLVVEDNEDLRAYIRLHLQTRYRIEECENGSQGLTIAQEIIPDLIISDWMMPQMNGIELCGHLKKDSRTSHIPVILLTALANQDAKLKGLETGADEYLTKPFSTEELDKRIFNLIENRRKLREYFSREIRLEPTQQVVTSAEEKFLKRVMQIVEEKMADSEFSVDELSREVGLSRVHLHRKLKALTGESASDFIRMMRLKRAAQLLEARAGNIAEIAYQVGFNTLSYFSKCFKEQFGVLPNEYIRKSQ
jgi:signal transduction histidine kinase/DNA-binding response OmpR family regulator